MFSTISSVLHMASAPMLRSHCLAYLGSRKGGMLNDTLTLLTLYKKKAAILTNRRND